MYIYFLFISFIYSVLYIGFKSPRINNNNLALFIIIIITLFASLRADVGTDTGSYLHIFESFKFEEESIYEKYEAGFSFLIHLLNIFNFPPFSLIIALGFIQGILLYYLVKRSSNPILFLAIYIGFFYFNFTFNILRAGVAALSTVLAISYALEEKKQNTFLCAFLACMFHVSSLIFLVPFYFYRSKNKLIYIFIFGLLIILLLNNNTFNYFLDKGMFYYKSLSNNDFNYLTLFIPIIIFFIFLYSKIKKPNKYILYLLIFDIFLRVITMFHPIVGRLELFISLIFFYFVIDFVKDRKKISNIVIASGFIMASIMIVKFEDVDRSSTELINDGSVITKFLPYRTIF
jgi:hypothetical protein